MRLFLDTADAVTVRDLCAWGAFAGVTTNPIILARAGLSRREAVAALGDAQGGDLFLQVGGATADEMEAEIHRLEELLPSRLMYKIPTTPVGLEVMSRLRDERIWTAATALFSPGQGLLAANAGADILLPFYSRISESGVDATGVVRDLVELGARRNGRPKVLVASLKTTEQVAAAARVGAFGATIPPELARDLLSHEGTDAALDRFAAAATVDEE